LYPGEELTIIPFTYKSTPHFAGQRGKRAASRAGAYPSQKIINVTRIVIRGWWSEECVWRVQERSMMVIVRAEYLGRAVQCGTWSGTR
jgi:hypothetical protein